MRVICVAGLLFAAGLGQPPPRAPQVPRPSSLQPPPSSGQRIIVHDGDLVVADNGARIRLLRRTDARVRAIYNAASRWIVVLVDTASPDGRPPDGGVDTAFVFNDVSGEWPLGERWEASAVLEEYSLPTQMGNHGIGLVTPAGLVQLLGGVGGESFRDQSAAATITYRGSGRGGGGNRPFDAVEAQQVGVATGNAANRSRRPSSFSSGVDMSIVPGPPGSGAAAAASPGAPVRVGGNVRTPNRVVYVPPVTPPIAAQANVRGVVIVEIVIGPDGAVSDAKILRSIALLDQAALDAVRQWRYEPTLLNGVPVPVILTTTVSFQ